MALRLGSPGSYSPIYFMAISRVVVPAKLLRVLTIFRQVNCHRKRTPNICHGECRKDRIIRHMWGPLSFSFLELEIFSSLFGNTSLKKKKSFKRQPRKSQIESHFVCYSVTTESVKYKQAYIQLHVTALQLSLQ